LAIAAPTWTEMMPATTSHTAGIRSGSRTEPLCQIVSRREFPAGLVAESYVHVAS
jgi:hypothetical protein